MKLHKIAKLAAVSMAMIMGINGVFSGNVANAAGQEANGIIQSDDVQEKASYEVSFRKVDSWDGHINGEITIKNIGDSVIEDWQLAMDFDGKIENIWNASVVSDDGRIVLSNAGWNKDITVGDEASFGFIAMVDSDEMEPDGFEVVISDRDNNGVLAAQKDGADGYICCRTYHTFGHAQYLASAGGGLRGIKYYKIGTEFKKTETNEINKAFSDWKNGISQYWSDKYIKLNSLNGIQDPQILIKKSKLESGIYGITRHLDIRKSILFIDQKGKINGVYYSSNIYMDTSQIENDGLKISHVAAHEIGHALGLSHRIGNKSSIMYNYPGEAKKKTPQKIDVNTVEHIYMPE